MIIYKNTKAFVINKNNPNENFADNINKDDVFVVNDNSELASKIFKHYPFYEFVLDKNNELIDILEVNEPLIVEPVDQEKVAMAEAIIDLNNEIVEIKNKLNGGI